MKSTNKKQSTHNPFTDLTWLDIQDWAGPKILSRGKSYKRSSSVEKLGITAKNELVAWVQGTTRYATRVELKHGTLSSYCTCPYNLDCKHGVAVVIEYLESLKEKKEIPIIASNDKRLVLIKQGKIAWPDELDDPSDNEADDDFSEEQPTLRRKRSGKSSDRLEIFLKNKSRDELLAIVKDIAATNSDIKTELSFKAGLSSSSSTALVKTIDKEIDKATSEPGWSNHWEHTGYTPDYSRVQSGLQKLYDAGKFDEAITLGKKLFTRGMKQGGQSDDEGETLNELTEALSVVYEALQKCSLPDVEKMEQAIDWELADGYSITDGLENFWKRKFGRSDWSAVADRLLKRLKEYKPGDGETDSHYDYKRDKLTSQILNTLDHAGRVDEKLDLCIREAPITKSYDRLVKMLREVGKNSDAEIWIRKGIAATRDDLPGIASNLQKHLFEIYARKRDWPFCAAIKADAFFEYPSLSSYKELKRYGEKAKAWDTIRPRVIAFLNNGNRPKAGSQGWSLPDTGIAPHVRRGYSQHPFTSELIEIALFEKDLDEALRIFDGEALKKKSNSPWGYHLSNDISDQIADAVKDIYPQRSISIWKKAAEGHINRTSPSEYAIAIGYLNRILKVMKKIGEEKKFTSYIASLRAENVRKIRLVQMLDGLSGKRIIDE